MFKKVLGVLFFVGAVLILVGSIANGSLFKDTGSAAANLGALFGKAMVIIAYILSGIFMFTFDSPKKLNYIDGFKKRSSQVSKITVFIIVYIILMVFAGFGAATSGTDNFILSYIIAIIPYLIPMLIFVAFSQMYATPHNKSKKFFVTNDAALSEYLSLNETYYSYSEDNSVLANSKALYFSDLFCVIPFDQIQNITLTKQLWEQDVYFNLCNGKKFYIVSKHFENIQAAINAYNQAQQ